MNQNQLMAIDTILPTILGIGGLIFVAAALWPIGREWPKRDRLSASLIGVIGAGCLGSAVWLWLLLYGSEGRTLEVQPGTSVTTVVSVPPSPQARPTFIAGGEPSASVSGSAAATVAPSAAASTSASAVSTPSLAPTPTIALTPVAAASFAPDSSAHGVVVAVQAFERGFMLYRDDTKLIYVLNQDKTFKTYPDTWVEGRDPDLGGQSGQPNKLVPGRGFGWLWASNKDIQQSLGLAIGKEMGFSGQVSGDGNSSTIQAGTGGTFVLNKDGTWSVK